ncbi:B12-binding domain-containing radical SAM protein [Thermodesulfobacteriota bacterium]
MEHKVSDALWVLQEPVQYVCLLIMASLYAFKIYQLMKKAGCSSIAFGIETGDPEVFELIQKGETLDAVVDAVKYVKEVGIKAVGYFIIGLPGDSLKTFIQTVRFQRSLKLSHFIFGMLIPYPNTEVWDIVEDRGHLLCDITQSQHFADDIVPVSFELPEWPKEDLVRAFYISKYYELFDSVQQAVERGVTPTAIYLTTPPLVNHMLRHDDSRRS